MTIVDCVVLGAGVSGVATAIALAEQDPTAEIALLDARDLGRPRDAHHDQTWSFWHVEPTAADAAVSARWDTCVVRAAGRVAHVTTPRTPYVSVRADDLRRDTAARLARHPRVHLHDRTRVLEVDRRTDDVRVRTDRGDWWARRVVDARGPRVPGTRDDAGTPPAHRRTGGPGARPAPRLPSDGGHRPGAPDRVDPLVQRFVGLRVRTTRPVFDAGTVTLMDFDVPQHGAPRFVYVLPTSPTEALVEDTWLTTGPVDDRVLEDGAHRYLADRYGLDPHEVDVVGSERGTIPMTPGPRRHDPDVVGARGGAVRPSTGYAFLRMHRAARAVAEGRLAPEDPLRRRVLDRVFLRFLVDRPAEVPGVFLRMAERVPAPALVRFLTERSSVVDELRLVLALPKRPFLGAAVRCLLDARPVPRTRAVRGGRAAVAWDLVGSRSGAPDTAGAWTSGPTTPVSGVGA